MQPLDVAIFKASAITTKLMERPGQTPSTEYIASLVDMAFLRAAMTETTMNGLRNSDSGL
jgi:hypothetical protein